MCSYVTYNLFYYAFSITCVLFPVFTDFPLAYNILAMLLLIYITISIKYNFKYIFLFVVLFFIYFINTSFFKAYFLLLTGLMIYVFKFIFIFLIFNSFLNVTKYNYMIAIFIILESVLSFLYLYNIFEEYKLIIPTIFSILVLVYLDNKFKEKAIKHEK